MAATAERYVERSQQAGVRRCSIVGVHIKPSNSVYFNALKKMQPAVWVEGCSEMD